MKRTLINSFKVSFAEGANTFIYFLGRIPLIGKKIPVSLYGYTEAKIALGVIYELFRIIGSVFKKAVYLGLMILLPSYLIAGVKLRPLPFFLHIFFFLSIVMGPLIHSTVFQ
jgi:hypothetical protein